MTAPARRGGVRRLLLFVPALAFLALAAAVLRPALFHGDVSTVPSALIGKAAPDFALPPLTGVATAADAPVPGLATADLQGGQPSVVNIFASWCAPCRDENPLLMQLGATAGVRLVGIDYKDEAGNARRFLNALGNPYSRIGLDASGRTGIDWGIYGVPETFVVDGRGRVVLRHVGPLTAAAISGEILPALAKAGSKATAQR